MWVSFRDPSSPEYIPDSQPLPTSHQCFLASGSYQVLMMPGLGSPESVPITVSMLWNQDVPVKHESGKISDWLWRLPLILKLNEVLKKNTHELDAYWFLIPGLVPRRSFSRSSSGTRICSRMVIRQSKDHTHTPQWEKKGILGMTYSHVQKEWGWS